MLARKALAGTAGAPKVYVEDVFSTYLYAGTGSAQTITNNIDLSGKGGAVWSKQRTGVASSNVIVDTARGVGKTIYPDSTTAEFSGGSPIQTITAFNNNGYSLGTNANFNRSGDNFVSWTFRKAEKFFDVVTFTGNGTTQTVNHNLGSAPGMVIVKSTGTVNNWTVWHRSLTSGRYIYLNTTDAQTNNNASNRFGNNTTTVDPTSTQFTVGSADEVNASGETIVAYLFAHDAGGFGDAGSDNVISCGSYTGNGSASGPTVTLGYEPQWVLVKRTDSTSNWTLSDNMRGQPVDGATAILNPNLSDAEASATTAVSPTATGFQVKTSGTTYNANGGTYIYIAIRRGPMKTPTTGTSVFQPTTYTGNNTYPRTLNTTITPDLSISRARFSTNTDPHDNYFVDRLRGGEPTLASTLTAAEDSPNGFFFDTQNGVRFVSVTSSKHNNSVDDYINLSFRRAPGFFDVVCYTDNGTNVLVNHNLTVTPDLIICKRRSSVSDWQVCPVILSATDRLILNSNAAKDNNGSNIWSNIGSSSFNWIFGGTSGATWVAYLFASVSGVSKIGTYTGNGSSVTVTTNFQPRFILVKRTDSTGDWIVSDSARGLVAGNDPYLELNTQDAEVTNEDWVDISSTSFTVNQTTNNANVNTGTYLYLAIA